MRRDIEFVEDWSNYETWCVRRWIISEPENAQAWRESTSLLMNNAPNDPRRMRNDLARELREEAEQYTCSFAGGLGAELIEAALSHVNWLELAEELILDHTTEGPDEN